MAKCRFIREGREITRKTLETSWFPGCYPAWGFQISAKPGGGKSAMIKFLCSGSNTKRLLESWTDGKKLIISRFFFWSQSDPIQKSLDGLMRSLLHGVLTQSRELIEVAFPEIFQMIKSSHWHPQLVPEIGREEVRQAFERLFSARTGITQSHRFCFFIDGLDESKSAKATMS